MTPIDLVLADGEAFGDQVAAAIVSALNDVLGRQDRARWCASAGSTPRGAYARLVSRFRQAVDWGRVDLIQMDDYVGMPADHPLSLSRQIRQDLADPLGIATFHTLPTARDVTAEAVLGFERRFATPLDLVVHGVGRNGHLGFNEPGAERHGRAAIVPLRRETLEDNFGDPTDRIRFATGVTLGLGVLLGTGRALVLMKGEPKGPSLKRLLNGPVSDDWPVSHVRTTPGTRVFADSGAMRAAERTVGRPAVGCL